MKLWFAPQISEHCPKYNPGRLMNVLVWFKRPGTASTLIPIDGIAHECSTSAAVIRIRICELIGSTVRLSTSSRRNPSGSRSCMGIIYESNSSWLKSEYSYDQYH